MSNYICNIRCSYRQPSGYCGSTGGYETCQYRQLHSKQTNADRIRAMTDEELAYELAVSGCPKIYFSKDKGRVDCRAESELTEGDCVKCWLDWLKQEVDG